VQSGDFSGRGNDIWAENADEPVVAIPGSARFNRQRTKEQASVHASCQGPGHQLSLIFRKSSEPGWRNWQTQRTQNPPTFGSWGFNSPSRHQPQSPHGTRVASTMLPPRLGFLLTMPRVCCDAVVTGRGHILECMEESFFGVELFLRPIPCDSTGQLTKSPSSPSLSSSRSSVPVRPGKRAGHYNQ
jgi:hypothetical protein